MGRHGGGAFSGKDPTKGRPLRRLHGALCGQRTSWPRAWRSAARWQLAYAIGVAEPVSVLVDTFGTGTVDEEKLEKLVRANFSLTPKGINRESEPAAAYLQGDRGLRPLRAARARTLPGRRPTRLPR